MPTTTLPSMSQAPPTRRRWFQFGLGTMLLLVTVFAVWLGWELSYIREHGLTLRAVPTEGGLAYSCPKHQLKVSTSWVSPYRPSLFGGDGSAMKPLCWWGCRQQTSQNQSIQRRSSNSWMIANASSRSTYGSRELVRDATAHDDAATKH